MTGNETTLNFLDGQTPHLLSDKLIKGKSLNIIVDVELLGIKS